MSRATNITRIIQSAYGDRYNLGSYGISARSSYYMERTRYMLLSFFSALRKQRVLLICSLTFLALAVISVYYYNMLVVTEQDVLSSKGKVEALLQRRNDISINLSKAVFDYSKHEQGVLTAIVGIRSLMAKSSSSESGLNEVMKKMGSAGVVPTGSASEGAVAAKNSGKATPTGIFSPLDRLLAVAEQYPDLKLSNTFLNLMTALINVETDLADQRIKFNDAVNIYTTNLAKFPINIYAALFSFETRPYFKATKDAQQLTPILY